MCTAVEDLDTLAQLDLIHFTLVFATIGTVCAILIGRVLIKLNYENLQKEADFRFSLVRLRENAESIAFYMGEKVERRETQKKFGRVIDNMYVFLCIVSLSCYV